MRRWTNILLGGLAALVAGIGVASADGEVGLVIQEGGEATTYCIAYTGDGITGEELLQRAGLAVGQFGGSARTVCSIGDTGCSDASSFTSCFCQCQGGSCVYWAFFTRENGKDWVYSSLAFNLLKAEDGDLHGWKWGAGGPSSAPAPVDLTFEQVCGHAPRGGAAVAAVATSTPLPAQQQVQQSTPAAPSAATPTATSTPAVAATRTVALPATPETAGATPTVVVTIGQTPEADTDGEDDAGANRDGTIAIIGFGVIAGLMLLAIGVAAVRGRRDDG
ncbi:MAG: hypothetical protein IH609_00820 [Dehalococcoidia bacterium]|nr:hypothetical protein [Dehalococcoidia bacterium]